MLILVKGSQILLPNQLSNLVQYKLSEVINEEEVKENIR